MANDCPSILRVKDVYEDEKRCILRNLAALQPSTTRAEVRMAETSGIAASAETRREFSVGSAVRTPPERPTASPPRPPTAQAAAETVEETPIETPPPASPVGERPPEGRFLVPPPGYPVGGGPPGGRFELPTTGEDMGYDDCSAPERRGTNRCRKKGKQKGKYGHQEDDVDFFRGTFEEEAVAPHNLDFGDDPSDKPFELYFPEFDFVKAMRSNSLRKWDGTIRDYPNFCHNYCRMVFVQREYMHKIMALEQMVPDQIKKELFHGLHNTVSDLGQRLS